jgi:hypothetical protein
MKADDNHNKLEEPFTEYGRYFYADYLTWEIEEMVEIIKVRVFKVGAAPNRKHQEIRGNFYRDFIIF